MSPKEFGKKDPMAFSGDGFGNAGARRLTEKVSKATPRVEDGGPLSQRDNLGVPLRLSEVTKKGGAQRAPPESARYAHIKQESLIDSQSIRHTGA